MKEVIILLGILLCANFGFSQDHDKCRKIVDLTVVSINQNSSQELKPYFDEAFSISAQQGDIALMIVDQLFGQLKDKVIDYKEIEQKVNGDELTLTYQFTYEQRGEKETTFLFTKSNLLKEMNLFKMQVKKMPAESKIKKAEKDIIEIPFKKIGNLIGVKVQLNGEIKTFILDSGAPKIILNSKYLLQKDSNRIALSSAKGVNGSISGLDIQKIENFDFEGIEIQNEEMLTLDIGHLEEELEAEIHGLIGFELIKDYDVLFDYEKQKITLIKPDLFEKYATEIFKNNRLETVPIKMEKHIPVVEIELAKKTYAFGIDSGAETNLIDKQYFSTLKKCTKNIEMDSLSGADKMSVEVKKGNLKKMKIGKTTFKKVETVFGDISHLNKGYQLKLDGLFGYQVLSRQKTLLSFKRKEMVFIK